MAFFNTESNQAENRTTSGQPPAGGTPLFKQDAAPGSNPSGQHVSLSDYISRHLAEEWSPEPASPAPKIAGAGATLNTPFHAYKPKGGEAGRQLNQLDVDLSAGLEQYLPTPVFRLRVVKKRLDSEITELKMRLNKYERLNDPSKEMQARSQELRERVAVLEIHEQAVSEELAGILRFGPFLYSLSKGFAGMGGGLGQLGTLVQSTLKRLLYGASFMEMEALSEKMRTLEEIMAERLKDPDTPDAEISHILNRYEQTLHETEAITTRKTSHNNFLSFPRRLWQQASRLVE
ncbi:MAG TPA: hypothetical protein V6C52_07320 [Coleofasciculaceae cyanobacterium]|jgi:hypothetical protein